MYAALVLLAITLLVNILGALILQRASLDRPQGSSLNEHDRTPDSPEPRDRRSTCRSWRRSLRHPRTLFSICHERADRPDDAAGAWCRCSRC